MTQTSIDWPSVVILLALALIFLGAYLYLEIKAQRAKREAEQRDSEARQRAEEAWYSEMYAKYKPTLTPEEVAIYQGTNWR